jgi:hypothetical protein
MPVFCHLWNAEMSKGKTLLDLQITQFLGLQMFLRQNVVSSITQDFQKTQLRRGSSIKLLQFTTLQAFWKINNLT